MFLNDKTFMSKELIVELMLTRFFLFLGIIKKP